MKHISRPKSATVKDIDINMANVLGQKYRYRIDIGHGNIDRRLNHTQCVLVVKSTDFIKEFT